MTFSSRRSFIALCAAYAVASLALATFAPISGASPDARGVALSDASVAPVRLVYVRAHGARTILRQCPHGHYFTEMSAYRWDGSALPAQRWNADGDRMTWGPRAVWDGITIRNRSDAPILFAGWCS